MRRSHGWRERIVDMEEKNIQIALTLAPDADLPTPEEAEKLLSERDSNAGHIEAGDIPSSLDDKIAAEEECAEAGPQPKKKTYTVRGMMSIARANVEPLEYLWNGIPMLPNGIIELIGAPGVGKSRFASSLARAQILGRMFGGRLTLNRPLRWLFVGSENGIHRLQRETQKFILGGYRGNISGWTDEAFFAAAKANGLAEKDILLLDRNFRTFTLESPDDCLIALTEENSAKMTDTLSEHKPDIVVVDPWGDLIDGDELSDADVRQTIRMLRACLAAAKLSVPAIIINHSRIGVREMANARGLDAGNFGKNSKCLYSIARYVLNIRPASLEDKGMIEVICAKSNDAAPPSPVAFRLNERTDMYEHLPEFDHDAWQKELSEKSVERIRGRSRTKKEKIDYAEYARKAMELIQEREEAIPKTKFVNLIFDEYADVTKRAAEHVVDILLGNIKEMKPLAEELQLASHTRRFPKTLFVGTREQIERLAGEAGEGNGK